VKSLSNTFFGLGLVGFIFGILFAEKSLCDFSASIYILVIGFIFAYLSFVFTKQKMFLVAIGIFLILFSLGSFRLFYENGKDNSLSHQVSNTTRLEGVVASDVTESKYYRNFKITPSEYQNEKILVRTSSKVPLSLGDIVNIEGVLSIPQNFENEYGVVFDYEGYLKSQGIEFVIEKAKIEKTGKRENGLMVFLFDIKKSFISNLERVFNFPESALLSGLLVGNKESLGEENLEMFRRAGVSHIIVLSGFNIAIVAVMIMTFAYFLPHHLKFLLATTAVILFSVMVGFEATVARATIMVLIAIGGKYIGRSYDALRALFVAGFLMITINPFIVLFDVSFQLSFMATLGLILIYPVLEEYFYRMPKMFGLREIILSTIAVEILVIPFILFKMGQVSLVSILSNIMILPVIAPTMLFGFLSGISGYISDILSGITGFPAFILLSYEMFVIKIMSSLPFALFEVKNLSVFLVFIIYGAVIIFLVWRENWKITDLKKKSKSN